MTQSKIFPQIENISCYTIDCSDDWKSKQKKIINNTNECIQSCDSSSQFPYEYNGKCYENCSNGFIYDKNNNRINKCKCQLEECLLCPNVALNKGLCTECNINYYPKENDPFNLGEYKKCYKDPEGYYLDSNIYKHCYYTCKSCNQTGNKVIHSCLVCEDNYSIVYENNNYLNCYENCSYYHYFDYEYIYYCTPDNNCPIEYPKLNEDKLECIKNDFNNLLENLGIIKNNKLKKMSKEEEVKYYDNIIAIIEEGLASNYDTSKLDDGQDEYITLEKLTISITTVENQKNNINSNMTRIDLGECETLLRNEYNISSNETLFMKKIDIVQEGMKIPKVEYDVYCKLFGKNLIKLNLTVCQKSKISILIPIEISEHLDIFNSSSGYYNDICYTKTSKGGTDISLKDRQKEFINDDKIVCQEDCDFSEYNYETLLAKCSCKVKKSSQSFSDMNIDKAKLLENFINIKNIINYNFLICYKKLLNKEGILNNIGCYIILAIILFHIITIFAFYIKVFPSIKKEIYLLVAKFLKLKENKIGKKVVDSKNNKLKNKGINIFKGFKGNKKKNNSKKSLKNKNIKKSKCIKKSNFTKKPIIYNNLIVNSRYEIKINHKDEVGKNENIQDYINEEINGLPYNLALKIDRRSYCQYYASLLKTQHNLICTFFNNNDYNSGIIKIDLFIIGFAIEYTINGLFYNDDTMHKIYESKGQFDFYYQLPIIIYSYLISLILNIPLNLLALSNDAIISFKRVNMKNNIKKKAKQLKNVLTIKFSIYFIISFLFLLFFLYYISLFDIIYKNTQIHLLKDTLMSFILSLLIPFAIYLIPGFFRILALSNRKNKRECLYKFSQFLQLL